MKLSFFFGILIALLAIAAADGAAPMIGLGRGDEFVLMQLVGLHRGLAVECALVCAYLLCIFRVSFGSDKIAWSFVIALVSALAILTALFLVWPVWRAFFRLGWTLTKAGMPTTLTSPWERARSIRRLTD